MNLINSIRSLWQTCDQLQNRLAVKYVVVGENPYDHIPRGSIDEQNILIKAQTNRGNAAINSQIKIILVERGYENMLSLIDLVAQLLDGSQFAIDDSRYLASLKFNTSVMESDGPLWNATLTFDTKKIYC